MLVVYLSKSLWISNCTTTAALPVGSWREIAIALIIPGGRVYRKLACDLDVALRMDLPGFKYHPAPLDTGSIAPSDRVCQVCERARGFAYQGGPYAVDDLE